MSKIATKSLWVVFVFCPSVLIGSETEPSGELTLEVRLYKVPDRTFRKIGIDSLKKDLTSNSLGQSSLVLNDVEAFFFTQAVRPDLRTNTKAQPKGTHRLGHEVVFTDDAVGAPDKCRVSIRPTLARDKSSFLLLVVTPKNSIFSLNGETKVRVPDGHTALFASRHPDKTSHIFLLITPRSVRPD